MDQRASVMSRQEKDAGGRSTYLSYLLRLWRVTVGSKLIWRASLEDPHTGEQLGFASLQALLGFLEERTGGTLNPRPEE